MTGDRLHECAAIGCTRMVPLRQFMCMGHWGQVPEPLRRALLRVLRREPGSGGRPVQSLAFRDAAQACRDAVARTEGKLPPEPVGDL